MLRVPIQKVEPWMVLARPIALPSDPRRFLVQRDQRIPPDLLAQLWDFGVREVWVRNTQLEFLESLIDEDLGDKQREVYRHVRDNFQQIMRGSAVELDLGHFTSSISEMFEALKSSAHGNVLLQKLDAFDNYLMSHSTNVCYLALLMGIKLEDYLIEQRPELTARDARDVQLLGLGCLLHDVGKIRVPSAILNKPAKLTPDEMEIMKLHPIYGYEMVKGRVPAIAAHVVLNHHQRWDGKGYPQRADLRTGQSLGALSGTEIDVFSRIATVVDVYDAATAQRCYSPAKLPVQALHEMRTWCAGFFDPVIEQRFYEVIPPFPIGQVVTLSNGADAAVVDFNPAHPVRPKVQYVRFPGGEAVSDPSLEEIDLSEAPELHVAAVDGVDVRPFLPLQETLAVAEPALV